MSGSNQAQEPLTGQHVFFFKRQLSKKKNTDLTGRSIVLQVGRYQIRVHYDVVAPHSEAVRAHASEEPLVVPSTLNWVAVDWFLSVCYGVDACFDRSTGRSNRSELYSVDAMAVLEFFGADGSMYTALDAKFPRNFVEFDLALGQIPTRREMHLLIQLLVRADRHREHMPRFYVRCISDLLDFFVSTSFRRTYVLAHRALEDLSPQTLFVLSRQCDALHEEVLPLNVVDLDMSDIRMNTPVACVRSVHTHTFKFDPASLAVAASLARENRESQPLEVAKNLGPFMVICVYRYLSGRLEFYVEDDEDEEQPERWTMLRHADTANHFRVTVKCNDHDEERNMDVGFYYILKKLPAGEEVKSLEITVEFACIRRQPVCPSSPPPQYYHRLEEDAMAEEAPFEFHYLKELSKELPVFMNGCMVLKLGEHEAKVHMDWAMSYSSVMAGLRGTSVPADGDPVVPLPDDYTPRALDCVLCAVYKKMDTFLAHFPEVQVYIDALEIAGYLGMNDAVYAQIDKSMVAALEREKSEGDVVDLTSGTAPENKAHTLLLRVVALDKDRGRVPCSYSVALTNLLEAMGSSAADRALVLAHLAQAYLSSGTMIVMWRYFEHVRARVYPRNLEHLDQLLVKKWNATEVLACFPRDCTVAFAVTLADLQRSMVTLLPKKSYVVLPRQTASLVHGDHSASHVLSALMMNPGVVIFGRSEAEFSASLLRQPSTGKHFRVTVELNGRDPQVFWVDFKEDIPLENNEPMESMTVKVEYSCMDTEWSFA